jgi:hypothetical protein
MESFIIYLLFPLFLQYDGANLRHFAKSSNALWFYYNSSRFSVLDLLLARYQVLRCCFAFLHLFRIPHISIFLNNIPVHAITNAIIFFSGISIHIHHNLTGTHFYCTGRKGNSEAAHSQADKGIVYFPCFFSFDPVLFFKIPVFTGKELLE